MNDTINGRTPEEIKKGLECCTVEYCYHTQKGCPYRDYSLCVQNVCADALAYIQQLENYIANVDKLVRRIEREKVELVTKAGQLERERDAAVEDIREAARTGCLCYVCHHNEKGHCKAFDHGIFEAVVMCGQYKWRGVQEVE